MVNAPPARILGYSPEELARLTVQELLPREFRDRFHKYVATLKQTGVAQGLMTVRARNGEQRIWEYRSALRTEGVPAPIVRGMARDVTERVTAERALRLSEAKFAAAFRATPCAIAISTIGEGRVLEINDACEAQTGYHRSEVIGRTGLDLGLWIDPAERAAIIAELKEWGKVTNREVRWRSKAGDELSILFSADTIAMRGQQHMLSVALDITAHKQVEARHHAILRALPDWMFLVSNEGVFLDCHVKDRAYLLAQPESFIGRNLLDVLPPRLAHDLRALFDRVVRTDEPGTLEYEVPINGETRYYEARAVRCDHDKVLSIVRDVTERKRAEHQARELGQDLAHIGRVTTLAALTGSLAHEIRQPLAAIRTNAQAAQRLIQQTPAFPDLDSALADIIADSQRAADVLQRVSGLLKRDTLDHKPVDLNSGLNEIVKVLHADLFARRISLQVELASDLPPVLGDRVQLQQVALNLLMNACDAAEDQSDGHRSVLLRTGLKESWVTVSVTDSGGGLTDAQLGQVFEPFYTTKVNGMGLGLPICEMIMNFHDGRLDVVRNAAKGMTFSFGLRPIASVAPLVGSSVFRSDTQPAAQILDS
jgi:PAS domain S-box-containing protein